MLRRMRKHLTLWSLAFVLTVGSALLPGTTSAQSTPQVQYPGELIDLSTFCVSHTQNAITPDSLDLPPGESQPPAPDAQQRVPVLNEPNHPTEVYQIDDSTDVLLHSYLKFGPYASLDLYGTAGWVGVEEGTIIVVSCTGDLVIDKVAGDGALSRIPAGIGAKVEAHRDAFIALDQMTGPAVVVNYGDGAASITAVQVQYDPATVPVCDPASCWDLSNVAFSDPGNGGCSGVRCWNW